MTASAVATVKGGLFGDVAGLTSLTQIAGRASGRFYVSDELSKRSLLPMRTVLTALLGAAPGALASRVFPQIDASTSELGGRRVINQVSLINRVTTAADVTEITNDILTYWARATFASSPPINKDLSPLGEQR